VSSPRPKAPSPVGVDAGGTFTDLVAQDAEGQIHVAKVPSTPGNPGKAVLAGLERLGPLLHGKDVVHGTTVALNALLTGRVARCALVTNRGFQDLVEIGRQNRPELYALHPERPASLVPRELRFELDQRSWPDPESGQVQEIKRPTDAQLARVAKAVAASGVRTAAVCLLHAYADPEPERRMARALEAAGVSATCSGHILPAYREYERFSTTIANAALVPVVSAYLTGLAEALPGQLAVLQSAGGTLPASTAGREPVRVLMSGPAGGVVGAARAAQEAGLSEILTLDMGGTSTDVAFAAPGSGLSGTTTASQVAGLPIAVPSLDLHTIGCGGGSLVRVDAGGVLRVGPDSAAADPGPVAYGRGEEPTVTDAHVMLGHLSPTGFLGGELPLDTDAVTRAFERVGQAAGLRPRAAAQAVLEVARAAMGRACSVMGLQRGRDPGRLALVAFGGGGGLHAAALAGSLDLPGALIPAHPGVLSALGMARADALIDQERAILAPLAEWSATARKRAIKDLVASGRERLREAGHSARSIELELALDLRYKGQSYELSVPENRNPAAAFEALHRQHYGWSLEAELIELVCLRVRTVVRAAAPALPSGKRPRRRKAPATCFTSLRKASIGQGAAATRVPCVDRALLQSGQRVEGPAVIEEFTGTTLVPAEWSAEVLPAGHLWLQGPS
jgi:N-methylhydantoinase A